ncbi:MAG: MBL fold metallo-hydrolase, partial [Clostridia bacterium]|nr:MBL fold metallo-hydrolase [Clostridia bacterium]
MAKSKSSKKRKISKIISLFIFIIIAIFAIVCYFNPNLYNKILSMLNLGDLSLLDDINRSDYPSNEECYMKVHFIDIGQGDSILIELPDSKVMLIDAGDNNNDNNTKLITYISERGIKQIDYVVATHADADHIGGMTDIFYNFEVKKVFRPYVLYDGDDYDFEDNYNKGSKAYKQDTKTYGNFLNAILNEEYKIDGVTKECEWEFFDYTSDFGGNVIYEGE